MFQPGDLIVYGRTGVCRVSGIEEWKGQRFYVLEPLYQRCSIKIPVGGKAFVRPVVSRQEADELIDSMPMVEVPSHEGMAPRRLTEYYQSFLTNRACRELVELTASLHAKKRAAQREKRKFGVVDERFLKEGEALLFGELSVALDIPVEHVSGYIQERLSAAGAEA